MAKNFLYTIFQKLAVTWRWLVSLTNRDGNPKTNDEPTYKHCMNCGEELVGMYCHRCGQYASPPVIKLSEFIKDYVRNLFSIESQAIPTIINLILHPGKIAKEFNAGRYVSYVNPLKLNIFILVVLITIFSVVGTDDKVKRSFRNLTNKEAFVSNMSLSTVNGDEEYVANIEASPRTTVTLISSQSIIEKFPKLVEVVEVVGGDKEQLADTMVVSVPTIFIKDKLLVEDKGIYHFVNSNSSSAGMDIVSNMVTWWEKSMSIIFAHFPLFMLLTTPFFVFPLRLLLRRRKYTMSNLYIFSLYYIAFVELFLTILFIGGLIFGFTADSVGEFLMVVLLLYLTVALKNAYELKWLQSLLYAVVTSAMYIVTTLVTIMVVSFVSIIAMVMQ
jgi:hypothetical protein